MNKLFKHLEDKNYWYKKYLASNEAFLVALRHAPEEAIDELEHFYGNRESLLKIIEGLDTKIQACLDSPEWPRNPSSEDRTRIQFFIREKDAMISRIVELDADIIAAMEVVLAGGLEKIKLLEKGKKALAKYKSTLNYNDKIDKRI